MILEKLTSLVTQENDVESIYLGLWQKNTVLGWIKYVHGICSNPKP